LPEAAEPGRGQEGYADTNGESWDVYRGLDDAEASSQVAWGMRSEEREHHDADGQPHLPHRDSHRVRVFVEELSLQRRVVEREREAVHLHGVERHVCHDSRCGCRGDERRKSARPRSVRSWQDGAWIEAWPDLAAGRGRGGEVRRPLPSRWR